MMASTMLAAQQLGWVGTEESRTVGLTGVGFSFPLEFTAAILAFLARDVLAATGLAVFSGIWLVTGLDLLSGAPLPSDSLGIFLLLGATALALILIAAGTGRPIVGVLIVAGFVRLLLTGLYELIASPGLRDAAGLSGLLLGGVAAVCAVILMLEDRKRQPLRLTGRRGEARAAFEQGVQEQVTQLENEAGVRKLL